MVHSKTVEKLRKEYASWFGGFQWDFFSTFSFTKDFGLTAAKNAFCRYHQTLKSIFDTNIPAIFIAEPHYVRGTHVHALLDNLSGISHSLKRLVGIWKKKKSHGRAEVEVYEESLGAEYYLSKYLPQRGKVEVEWGIRDHECFELLKGNKRR